LSSTSLVYRGEVKPIIPGFCRGEVTLVDGYISFFGEVSPDRGCLSTLENKCFNGKVLVFKGTRGSTVAPYVIYALRRNNTAPVCILVAEVEPMLIVGCVIAEIPLFVVKDYEGLVKNIHVINNSGYLEVRGSELLLYRRV